MLEFSWEAFAFAVVNFLLLVALLYRFLHKPLLDTLQRRRETIEQARKDAESKAEEARQAREEYKAQVSKLQEERDVLLAEARRNAEEARDALLAKAREEAERQVANLRTAYDNERLEALKDLQEDVVDVALETARAILQELVGVDADSRLHAQLLAELDSLASDQGRRPAELAHAQTPVRVWTARKLAEPRRAEIAERVRALAGKQAQIDFRVDEGLVAGARVEFSSVAVDSSLADVLQATRERFDRLTAEADARQRQQEKAEQEAEKAARREEEEVQAPAAPHEEAQETGDKTAGEQPPPAPPELPASREDAAPEQVPPPPPPGDQPGKEEGEPKHIREGEAQ